MTAVDPMNSDRKLPQTRLEAGLPDDAVVKHVLFNHAADQTIVEVQVDSSSPLRRLFCRKVGSLGYEALGSPEPGQSCEGAVTCDLPIVFAQLIELRSAEHGWNGTTLGLWRVGLGDRSSATLVDLSQVLPPHGSLSRLLRVNDSGTRVVAVIGFGKHEPGGYWICTLDLENSRTIQHDKLHGVLF
jgi:hypothetical protein